ncbi:allantoinase AllB [soil metagenome]
MIVRGLRVVTRGGMGPAAVHVVDGRITAVTAYDQIPPGAPLVEVGDAVLLPGLVDTHVHINEPGRTEWEGFETATRAAAAGGVTTLVDMPLNSIPATTNVANFSQKLQAAGRKSHVDVAFWGGVVPGNQGELRPLWDAGMLGFKCFLAPSGVDEFPHVGEVDLRATMPVLAELGAPLLAHAELLGPLELAAALPGADPRSYRTYLASRPRAAENEAITLLIRLCREFGTRVHVVHLASADALPLLRSACAEGLPITVETCPHYLHFAAEAIPEGATALKCAPPIRERENREHLWNALREGLIDMIVSDHSPCPPAMKALDTGSFMQAWGGIASLQLGLSVIWAGARTRDYTFQHLAEWMSRAPARLAGLEGCKGAIAPGYDADMVVWDPEAEYSVEPGMLHHRHKLSPYLGQLLPGVVRATYLRGEKVYERGRFPSGPTGRVLLRGDG